MKKEILLIGAIMILVFIVDLIFILMSDGSITGNSIFDFSEKHSETGVITKIIDGDTVVVEGGDHVRLLGIDCDEKGKKCYKAANLRIEELALGKKAVFEYEGEDKDQYGRKLRYIIIDGKNINLQMVEEGLCVARFYQDSIYKKEIQNAESNAIENKIGCKWNG